MNGREFGANSIQSKLLKVSTSVVSKSRKDEKGSRVWVRIRFSSKLLKLSAFVVPKSQRDKKETTEGQKLFQEFGIYWAYANSVNILPFSLVKLNILI